MAAPILLLLDAPFALHMLAGFLSYTYLTRTDSWQDNGLLVLGVLTLRAPQSPRPLLPPLWLAVTDG
jgi:hypothetical protein